jgi:hypothetical protein
MKQTKKAKKAIRTEESIRTLNFESGKHLLTIKKVIYDDGSYAFINREESVPFFASSKYQDKLVLICKQYSGLLESAAMQDQKTALIKSLSKFLTTIQAEYNARGKDQVAGIEEWSAKTYGFDFSILRDAKKKPKSKKAVKDKLVKDQGCKG